MDKQKAGFLLGGTFLLVSCRLWPSPAPESLPRDVQTFVEDRDLCDHLRGEIPEPGTSSSESPTIDDINRECAGTDIRLDALRAKHAKDLRVMEVLSQYEWPIEAGSPTPTPSARRAEDSHASQTVILLDPMQGPNTYDYALAYGDHFPSPGTVLNVYRNGTKLGTTRVVSTAEPPFGDGLEIVFDPKIAVAPGTLLSARDINPGARYRLRAAATQTERAELVALANLSRYETAPRFHLDGLGRTAALNVVTDTRGKRGDVAIYTSEIHDVGATEGALVHSYIGIFIRPSSGKWQVEYADAQSGCDDCEARHQTYDFVGFGELRPTGGLTLLFNVLAYESWGTAAFELTDGGHGEWLWHTD